MFGVRICIDIVCWGGGGGFVDMCQLWGEERRGVWCMCCVFFLGGGGELVEMTYQGYRVSEIIVSTQIARTRAEPQQIVAQRLLSCLQYPVPYLSRLQRI